MNNTTLSCSTQQDGYQDESQTVLLVDDDELSRSVTRRMITFLGYNVLEAHHGAEALRLMESAPQPIEAIVTDVYMPGLRGSELAAIARATRPDLRVLFMSGYEEGDMARSGVDTRSGFLHKPFGLADLRSALFGIMNPLTASP